MRRSRSSAVSVGVAGDVAQLEQARTAPEVAVGHLDGLGQRAHRVVEADTGVPDRVPEPLGERA